MDDISALAYQIDQGRIARARAMPLAEKFFAGAILFEEACEITRTGIRSENSAWNNEQVEAELYRRLELRRRLESRPSK